MRTSRELKLHVTTSLEVVSYFTFAISFSPTFEYAKDIEEIYTVYFRSEHVLLVKLKGQDTREKIFRFSEEEERERGRG